MLARERFVREFVGLLETSEPIPAPPGLDPEVLVWVDAGLAGGMVVCRLV